LHHQTRPIAAKQTTQHPEEHAALGGGRGVERCLRGPPTRLDGQCHHHRRRDERAARQGAVGKFFVRAHL
jgi:hypothetical protein